MKRKGRLCGLVGYWPCWFWITPKYLWERSFWNLGCQPRQSDCPINTSLFMGIRGLIKGIRLTLTLTPCSWVRWSASADDLGIWGLGKGECTGEGNGNPLQCSCLENPRDGGAWWAAVYEVAQSQTRLKRLSKQARESLGASSAGRRVEVVKKNSEVKNCFT